MRQARPPLELTSQNIRINTSIRPTNTMGIILSVQALHMTLCRLSPISPASARRTAAKAETSDTKIIEPRHPARKILIQI
jgi:hypothetical protein